LYLVSSDDPPTCESCGLPLTVKHVVVEFANLWDIREKYFMVDSVIRVVLKRWQSYWYWFY